MDSQIIYLEEALEDIVGGGTPARNVSKYWDNAKAFDGEGEG